MAARRWQLQADSDEMDSAIAKYNLRLGRIGVPVGLRGEVRHLAVRGDHVNRAGAEPFAPNWQQD
jgi:hypothetical protein